MILVELLCSLRHLPKNATSTNTDSLLAPVLPIGRGMWELWFRIQKVLIDRCHPRGVLEKFFSDWCTPREISDWLGM